MTRPTANQPIQGQRTTESSWAAGFAFFAAVLMICIGIYQALVGLVALFRNEFYMVTADYLYKFDVTAWGWIHLLLGALVVFAGFGVMSGALWGRGVGIALAVLSLIANFLFIPYYPIWSLLIIALDVFVISALCVYDREAART